MSLDLKLSANIKIGGKTIPLTSVPIHEIVDAANGKAEDVKTAFKNGITFGLPPGAEVSVQLKEIVGWIKKGGGGLEILGIEEVNKLFGGGDAGSSGFVNALQEAHINISAFHINTKGAFSIAVELGLGEGGLAGLLKTVDDNNGDSDLNNLISKVSKYFNINAIGLAFDWEQGKENSVANKGLSVLSTGTSVAMNDQSSPQQQIDAAGDTGDQPGGTKGLTALETESDTKDHAMEKSAPVSEDYKDYQGPKQKKATGKTAGPAEDSPSKTNKSYDTEQPDQTKPGKKGRDIPPDAPDMFG